MSTTKHTPGPWFCSSFQVWAEKEGRRFGTMVATLRSTDTTEQAAEADARLIAAAPELLEALQDAMKVAIHEEHPFRSWHNKAKAAIAKATGTNA